MRCRTRHPGWVILPLWLLAVGTVVGMAVGCARSPGVPSGVAGAGGTVRSHHVMAGATLSDESEDEADYDPWHAFNERMFSFNHDVLDRWLVKPAATGWATICPDTARRSSRGCSTTSRCRAGW